MEIFAAIGMLTVWIAGLLIVGKMINGFFNFLFD